MTLIHSVLFGIPIPTFDTMILTDLIIGVRLGDTFVVILNILTIVDCCC